MIRYSKLILLGATASCIGVAGVAPTIYYTSQNHVSATPTVVTSQTQIAVSVISGKPIQLQITQLGLDIAVVDGQYNQRNGQWTLSSDKAHFALPSTTPNNEQGSTLIYGHYRPEVFARLRKLQPGQEAIITTDAGYRFIYTYNSSVVAKPTDTSIFGYRGAPKLTLQTCSGAWMQNRQLYSFDFVRYEKIKS